VDATHLRLATTGTVSVGLAILGVGDARTGRNTSAQRITGARSRLSHLTSCGGKPLAIDTAYRFPQFGIGNSVGEMQGEMQVPPESLRIGKRCILTDTPISNEDVPDRTAGKFVHYLG
jgi:hypothetical protein